MYIIVARSADRCENQADVKDFNLQKILIFDTTINLNIQKKPLLFHSFKFSLLSAVLNDCLFLNFFFLVSLYDKTYNNLKISL